MADDNESGADGWEEREKKGKGGKRDVTENGCLGAQ